MQVMIGARRMIWNIKNVLVLSAHTDDMEVGAGGTIRRLIDNGIEVKSVVFSDCKKSVDTTRYPEDVLRQECKAAANHLGIKDLTIYDIPVRDFPSHRQDILDTIYKIRKENELDLVLTTWENDLHQDHKVVAEETFRAFMKTRVSILCYEIAGNSPGFTPDVFIPLSEEEVAKKIEMLRLYESQTQKRDYFRIEAVRSVMGYQGHHCGSRYAEAFSLHRGVVTKFNEHKVQDR